MAVFKHGIAFAVVLSLLEVCETSVNRLTVVNGCQTEPIWITHLANVGTGPGAQNRKLDPAATAVFDETLTDGLAGARYWPKMGCDENGDNCALGGSGGPSQQCNTATPDYSSCAPPIDTKFEATWGRQGEPCNPQNPGEMGGCDFIDVSLVDGWTLPFKLEIVAGSCTGNANKHVPGPIDCSGLTVDNCPVEEDLGHGPVDMRAISPHTGKPAGCYSPCLKLVDPKWNNVLAQGKTRDDADVTKYCCTTPPESSQSCNAGPIPHTRYVETVHEFCPGSYAFAYDDGRGLLRCSYGQYKLTFFCPGEPVSINRNADSFLHSAPAVPSPASAPVTLTSDQASPTAPVGESVPSPAFAPVTLTSGQASPTAPAGESVPSPAFAPVTLTSDQASPTAPAGGSAMCLGFSVQCSGNSCCPDGSKCPSAAASWMGCPGISKLYQSQKIKELAGRSNVYAVSITAVAAAVAVIIAALATFSVGRKFIRVRTTTGRQLIAESSDSDW